MRWNINQNEYRFYSEGCPKQINNKKIIRKFFSSRTTLYTAAHCTRDEMNTKLYPDFYTVTAGHIQWATQAKYSPFFFEQFQERKVEKMLVHP